MRPGGPAAIPFKNKRMPESMPDAIISVQNLTKTFTNRKRASGLGGSIKSLFFAQKEEIAAVDNINFEVQKGELVGYLGPNGAGKSTTIKMLTGILRPTSGRILVGGIDPVKDRRGVSRQIGVVFGQKTQLWWDLPVGESFDLLRLIYKIPQDVYKKRMEFFSDLLGIGDFVNQQTRKLSLGQRMRSDLAASLLHNPPILFLDEPTIGLDILTRDTVREFIRNLNRTEKTTILLTTHDIQDIEFLAQRLILLDKGKTGYDGNIGDFIKSYAPLRILTVHLETPLKAEWLQKQGYAIASSQSERHYDIRLEENQNMGSLIESLTKNGNRIEEIQIRNQDLGETLKLLYRGKKGLEL